MDKRFTSALKGVAVAALFSLPAVAMAQQTVTVFNEDFGTAADDKKEKIEDHVWENNPASMFSWYQGDDAELNVRNNKESDYDGASGSGNLYLQGSASFTISGINTEGYSDLKLSLGVFGKNNAETNTTAAGQELMADVNYLKATCAADGGEAVEVADFSKLNLSQDGDCWDYVDGIALAQSAKSLTLTFKTSLLMDAEGGIRLDDIKVTGTNVSSGISDELKADAALYVNGRTISYNAQSGSASVYSLQGSKVAEVKAGETVQLTVVPGVYVVKAGSSASKILIK